MNDMIHYAIALAIILVAVFIAIGNDRDGRGA